MLSYARAIKFEVRSEEARGRTLAEETSRKEGRKESRKTDIWRECVLRERDEEEHLQTSSDKNNSIE